MNRTGTCIGGPKDGECVTTNGTDKFKVMEAVPLTPHVPADSPAYRQAFRDVIYREEMIRTDRGDYRLWVLEGLSTHEALGRLIQHYEDHRPDERR